MSSIDQLRPLEHMPLAAWVTAYVPHPHFVWANPAALELWRADSLDEILGRDISDMSASSKTQAAAWTEAFISGRSRSETLDWTVYPKDVPTQVTIHITLFRLDDGEPALLSIAVPRQTPLTDAQVRNAEAVRHIAAVVALVAPDGEILSRNPAALDHFGLDAPLRDWFVDEAVVGALLEVTETGRPHRALARGRVGERERVFNVEGRKTLDPATGAAAVLVHMTDETARLGAEREVAALNHALARVEAQERRWRALVDSAPDLIMLIDGSAHVSFANHALGLDDPAALVGRPLVELLASDSRATAEAALARALASAAVQTCELRWLAEHGVREHQARLCPVDTGDSVQVMLISTDVSEQRALAQQLHHSQKMEALGTLASGLAHDFNNLLAVILGACDIAELKLGPDNPAHELFTEVNDAAERATQLTRQLLRLGRKQPDEPERLELNELVRGMTTLLTRALGDGVELRLELDAESCWVHAGRSELEQVIMNLAINGRDAMPEGGELRLRTRAHAAVELQVSDTGVGMSSELQARVFEPFFTTKTSDKGTGLGLAMVHTIIERSGGTLELDSAPGRGTRFTVRLPRSPL